MATPDPIRPNRKICVFPVTCFLKLGLVGRIIFSFFEIILDLPEVLFIKTELVYLYFQSVTWCHGSLLLHFHWLTV